MRFRNAALWIAAAALAAPVLAETVVPKATIVEVVLNNVVSSKTSMAGDKFQAEIAQPKAGFPAGTLFVGELTKVVPKTDTAPGMIEAKVTTAILPDKTEVPVRAVPCTAKGEIRTVVTGKNPTERQKSRAAKLGAIAAILAAPTPEEANTKAGAEAGLKRVGKPGDVEAAPGRKFCIYLQEDVHLK